MKSKDITRRCFSVALVAGATFLIAASAHAQAWPSKPIKVIVPYTPGGFTDITARLVSQKLQDRLGQPVLVENKPGANSIIGVDALAKAPPDGYTFAVVIAAFAANTTLYPKLPYDPKKDFAAVSLMGISPLVAAANNDAPFKNASELIDYARKNPGKVSYGSSGNGSAVNLTTELLKSMTRTDMVHVPYKGSAPALNDLMAGHIQLFMDAAVGLIAPGKAGKVRLIGVASERRLAVLPDVPTFIEQGIQGFTGSTWAGIVAPAGTPPAVIKRVADEVAAIVKLDDVKERLDAMGTIPVGSSSAEFEQFLTSETIKWGKVIREAKITAD